MVRLLSRVYAQVALQRLQVAEARSADLAGIRLLPRVDQHVGAQVSNLPWPNKITPELYLHTAETPQTVGSH